MGGCELSRPSRSYSELYYPADTLRRCPSGPACWCHNSHRDSKYYYVEKGGDGTESYHDPFEYVTRFMMGGGGMPMPWKSVRDWTTRDYDRLGEVMSEYYNRMRGRQMGLAGDIQAPLMASMMPMSYMGGLDDYRPSAGRRHHYSSSRMRAMEDEIHRLQRFSAESQDRMKKISDQLFGSENDLFDDQYKRQLMKQVEKIQQEIMNGRMGMPGTAGMVPNMMNPQMGMPMGFGGAFNPQQQQFTGIGMNPAMGMHPGMGGTGGMGGMGGMNGVGGYGMNGMMPQTGMAPMMNGYPEEMYGAGSVRRGGFGRGNRRPMRGLAYDDFDDDFDGMDMGVSRFNKRRGNRPRRWPDDEDPLDGLADGGSRTPPRGPGPRRPRRDGPLGGGGGAGRTWDMDDDFDRRRPYRETQRPPVSPPPSPPERVARPTRRPEIVVTPHEDPPQRASSPPVLPPGFRSDIRDRDILGGGLDPGIPPAGMPPQSALRPGAYKRPSFDMDGLNLHRAADAGPYMMSGGVGTSRAEGLRPPGLEDRRASFQPEAQVTRPREEEQIRREPDAGAQAQKRDVLPPGA